MRRHKKVPANLDEDVHCIINKDRYRQVTMAAMKLNAKENCDIVLNKLQEEVYKLLAEQNSRQILWVTDTTVAVVNLFLHMTLFS